MRGRFVSAIRSLGLGCAIAALSVIGTGATAAENEAQASGVAVQQAQTGPTRKRREVEQRREEERREKAEKARKKREAEARRKAEEKRRAEEEKRRKAEEARRRREGEARRKAEEERRQREAEGRRKTEEARKRREAEARRKAAEERRKRAATRRAGAFKDCAQCPAMVAIPGGSFQMGSNAGYSDEKPVHRVTVRRFAMGKYEVTFAEWDACQAAGGCSQRPGDEGWGRGRRPVINVSWNDAKQYVAWLSRKTGKRYRLPSEAEWEYAARAGTRTAYYWGSQASHQYANYGKETCCAGLASGRDRWVNTSPVGSFPPNRFGLYDMLGNVWEWVEDCWNKSYAGAPANGRPWTTGGNCSERVLRGGSWVSIPRNLRAANRRIVAGFRIISGFRVARTLP